MGRDHEEVRTALESMTTNADRSVMSISQKSPVLLIFLRHFGCVFCREAMHDIAQSKSEMQSRGVEVVFVHMGEEDVAQDYFDKFDISELERVSDTAQRFYRAFGLVRARTGQLASFRVFLRGFQAGVGQGLGAGSVVGDGFQMPGVFVLRNGEVVGEFIHKDISERPDYLKLVDEHI